MINLDMVMVAHLAGVILLSGMFIYTYSLSRKFQKLTKLVKSYVSKMEVVLVDKGIAPPSEVLIRKWRKELKKSDTSPARKQAYRDKLLEYNLLDG